jgi:CO/xanthine dehydrogenase Mo-binding subunit
MAVKAADYAGFEKRRQKAAKRGKLRGIGISTYIEACAMAPSVIAGQLGARAGFYETAEVRAHPTGTITVFTGSHSHGQGHETTFAQLVANRFDVPIEMVDIVHGDTGQVPFGMGTYASRSLAVGGTALVKAMDKIIAKAKKIAAHLLEAAEADIEFADGKFSVAGTDRAVPFAQVAFAAYVPHNYPIDTLEPGLNETAFYDPINFTYPAGAYIAEIEIDRETGTVELANFTGADDFGRIINPLSSRARSTARLSRALARRSMRMRSMTTRAASSRWARSWIIACHVPTISFLSSSRPTPRSARTTRWAPKAAARLAQLRQVPACSLAGWFGAGLSVRGLWRQIASAQG